MKPKKTKSKGQSDEKIAQTLGVAAARLSLPKELLRTAKHMGCPAFRQSGRVHLAELKDWIKAHPDLVNSSEEMIGIVKENFLKAKAERETREHRLAVLRRDVIPVKEVRITLTRAIVETKKRFLEGMRTSMQEAALHCNADEKQIAWCLAQGEKRARDILIDLSKTEFSGLDCPHCAKRIEATV